MLGFLKQYIANMFFKTYYFLVPPGEAGFPKSTQFNYLNASEEGYKQVVWVYRCVNEVAKRVSSVPFKIYHANPDGTREEVQGKHPLKSFLQKPNKRQGWNSFIRSHVIFLRISGNSFWDISSRVGQMPGEVYLLRPDRIKIIPSQGENENNILRYEYTVGSTVKKIPTEDIVHYVYFDPSNDYYGLSPLFVAGNVIDTESDAINYNKYLMRNQARPSGVLQTDTKLTTDAFKRLQVMLQEWLGKTNQGKPIILEAGLKWAQAQLSHKDAEYINLRKLNREEMCAVFGVPPVIAGILDRATYSNFKEADTIFWNQEVIPELRSFRDDFNTRIVPFFDSDAFVDYDLSHVEALKENEDSMHKRAREGYQVGILSRNEARKIANQKEEEGSNFYLMPSGVVAMYGAEKKSVLPSHMQKIKILEYKKKILNLGKDDIQEYQEEWRENQEWLIEKGTRSILPVLRAYNNETAAFLGKQDGKMNPESITAYAIDEHKKAVKEWYQKYYEITVEFFGNRAIRDMRNSVKLLNLNLGTKAQGNIELGDELMDWLSKLTAGQIKRVSNTTKQDVTRIIEEGIENGDTTKEMAEAILSLNEITTMLRAEMIAVTEVHTASNAGNYWGIMQTGVGEYVKKKWHTSIDGREREWHRETDVQVKAMNAPFVTGRGNKLLFPGDHSKGAPANEIIRCRCCFSYITTDIGGLVSELTTGL